MKVILSSPAHNSTMLNCGNKMHQQSEDQTHTHTNNPLNNHSRECRGYNNNNCRDHKCHPHSCHNTASPSKESQVSPSPSTEGELQNPHWQWQSPSSPLEKTHKPQGGPETHSRQWEFQFAQRQAQSQLWQGGQIPQSPQWVMTSPPGNACCPQGQWGSPRPQDVPGPQWEVSSPQVSTASSQQWQGAQSPLYDAQSPQWEVPSPQGDCSSPQWQGAQSPSYDGQSPQWEVSSPQGDSSSPQWQGAQSPSYDGQSPQWEVSSPQGDSSSPQWQGAQIPSYDGQGPQWEVSSPQGDSSSPQWQGAQSPSYDGQSPQWEVPSPQGDCSSPQWQGAQSPSYDGQSPQWEVSSPQGDSSSPQWQGFRSPSYNGQSPQWEISSPQGDCSSPQWQVAQSPQYDAESPQWEVSSPQENTASRQQWQGSQSPQWEVSSPQENTASRQQWQGSQSPQWEATSPQGRAASSLQWQWGSPSPQDEVQSPQWDGNPSPGGEAQRPSWQEDVRTPEGDAHAGLLVTRQQINEYNRRVGWQQWITLKGSVYHTTGFKDHFIAYNTKKAAEAAEKEGSSDHNSSSVTGDNRHKYCIPDIRDDCNYYDEKLCDNKHLSLHRDKLLWQYNVLTALRKSGLSMSEIETEIRPFKIGTLRDLTFPRWKYWESVRRDAIALQDDIASRAMGQYERDYLAVLQCWLRKYRDLDPVEKHCGGDGNTSVFFLTQDPDTLRDWVRTMPPLDTRLPDCGAWVSAELQLSPLGDTHDVFSAALRSHHSDDRLLRHDIQGAVAWTELPQDVISTDQMTRSQQAVHEAREKRGERARDPGLMKKRREHLAFYFQKKYGYNLEHMSQFQQWADRMEQNERELSALCCSDV